LKNINYDIQASARIISILTQSKLEIENILNDLDNIFIIINDKYEVLKCNSSYSKNLDPDSNTLRANFIESLQNEYQQTMKGIIYQMAEDKIQKDIEFKLKDNRLFYVKISVFEPIRKEEGKLFKITGTDVTSLRESEAQMMDIMGVINLGIVFIDKYNNILPGHSEYSKAILEDHELIGKDINSIFFEKTISKLSTSESQAINNLPILFGSSEIEFKTNAFMFPEYIEIDSKITDNAKKLIHFTIEPILLESKVDRYMMILQDVTASKGGDEKSFAEDISHLLVKIDKDKDNTITTIYEINNLFTKLTNTFKNNPNQCLKGPLHSLKGILRVLGLNFLAQLVHDSEDLYSGDIYLTSDFKILLDEIIICWDKLFKIFGYLTLATEDRTSLSFVSKVEKLGRHMLRANLKEKVLSRKSCSMHKLEKLTEIIEEVVVTNVTDLDYQVDFETDFCLGFVHSEVYQALKYSLIHMINNSFAHGFDKNGTFLISVQSKTTSTGDIELIYKDDGSGINIKKLKEVIIKKEGRNSISDLSDMKIAEYIFKEDLSTKDEVTEISGRGVGLAAAYYDVTKLGGEFKLTELHKGCSFQINVPVWPSEEIPPSVISNYQLTNLFELLTVKNIDLPIGFYSFTDLFRFCTVLDFLRSEFSVENLKYVDNSIDHQFIEIETHISSLLGEDNCKIYIADNNQLTSLAFSKLKLNEFSFPEISISKNVAEVKDYSSFFSDFFGKNQSVVKINATNKSNSNVDMKTITLNFFEEFLELQLLK
jgi:hypothetical protein